MKREEAAASFSAVGPILLGTKTSPKSTCCHVIFDVNFKFQIKITGGEDFN
jgi:hypothetical protein